MRIPSPEPEFVVPDWPSDKGPRWYPKQMGLLGDWGYAMDVSGKTSSKRDHSCFITVSIIHSRHKLTLRSQHYRAPFLSRRSRSWHGMPSLAGLESLLVIPYSTTWRPSCGSCGSCASTWMGHLTGGDVSQSEILGWFYNPNTTQKRQRESGGLPARNWTGVALKGVLHQGD